MLHFLVGVLTVEAVRKMKPLYGGGHRMIVQDDYSRPTLMYFLRYLIDAATTFERFLADALT